MQKEADDESNMVKSKSTTQINKLNQENTTRKNICVEDIKTKVILAEYEANCTVKEYKHKERVGEKR